MEPGSVRATAYDATVRTETPSVADLEEMLAEARERARLDKPKAALAAAEAAVVRQRAHLAAAEAEVARLRAEIEEDRDGLGE
jgi:hypothetical protein